LRSGVFSRRLDDRQDEPRLSSILYAESTARRVKATFEAWRNGDATAMEQLIADDDRDPQSKPFLDELVYQTNANTAQQLEVYLSTPHKYFVVIGARHLIGDRNIVQLLQEKGYRVVQLIGR
jgi:uncharacterized protein YbaP (TraB family)